MKRFVTILTAVTVMSVSVLASTPARATAPGRDGRIAFRRYLNRVHKRGAIFTIHPDGTAERQVTHPPKGVLDTQPDVSPDGRWITFTRIWQSQGPRGAIVRIHPNGEGRDILTRATCTRRRDASTTGPRASPRVAAGSRSRGSSTPAAWTST